VRKSTGAKRRVMLCSLEGVSPASSAVSSAVTTKDAAASGRVGLSVGRLLEYVNQNVARGPLESGRVTYSEEGHFTRDKGTSEVRAPHPSV